MASLKLTDAVSRSALNVDRSLSEYSMSLGASGSY